MPLTAREKKIQKEKRLSSLSRSSLGIFLSLFLSSASREIRRDEKLRRIERILKEQ